MQKWVVLTLSAFLCDARETTRGESMSELESTQRSVAALRARNAELTAEVEYQRQRHANCWRAIAQSASNGPVFSATSRAHAAGLVDRHGALGRSLSRLEERVKDAPVIKGAAKLAAQVRDGPVGRGVGGVAAEVKKVPTKLQSGIDKAAAETRTQLKKLLDGKEVAPPPPEVKVEKQVPDAPAPPPAASAPRELDDVLKALPNKKSADSIGCKDFVNLCTKVLSVVNLLGKVMHPVGDNIRGNVKEVEKFCQNRSDPLLTAASTALIHEELPKKKRRPPEAEPFIWLCRQMRFMVKLFKGIAQSGTTEPSVVADAAYKQVLESHMTWVQQSAFSLGLRAMPARDVMLKSLAGQSDVSTVLPALDNVADGFKPVLDKLQNWLAEKGFIEQGEKDVSVT